MYPETLQKLVFESSRFSVCRVPDLQTQVATPANKKHSMQYMNTKKKYEVETFTTYVDKVQLSSSCSVFDVLRFDLFVPVLKTIF